MRTITLGILSVLLLTAGMACAQKWGRLSGSIESTAGFYMDDKKTGGLRPEEDFGLNTWLNLNYSLQKFRFDLQYEIYEPPFVGFPVQLEGNKLIQGFAEYQNRQFFVRLGSVFEQFGSGLLFRTYEERALGLNNAVLGANVRWTPCPGITLKVVAGSPRKYLDYEKVWVYGADGEVGISELLGWQEMYWNIGGSWMMRDDHEYLSDYYPAKVRGWAVRTGGNYGSFSFDGEYVSKSNSIGFDAVERYYSAKGSALLLNLGLDIEGVGMMLGLRRLEHMDMRIDNQISGEQVSLNYLPSLTRQHKYTLAALYPFPARSAGEIGGQFDLFGEIPAGILGRQPVKATLNMALYNMLEKKDNGDFLFLGMNGRKMFREIGVELERKWKERFKSVLAYSHQEQSAEFIAGYGEEIVKSDILVGDVLYKITPYHSLRLELQHMWSRNIPDKAWWFAQLEYGWAPKWMLYVSDMCNYDTSGETIHYYLGGMSFTQRSFRTSLSYGRNRAGNHCVGGVCRYVPDYTGFNLSLNWTF